jgi:hypothetical protein
MVTPRHTTRQPGRTSPPPAATAASMGMPDADQARLRGQPTPHPPRAGAGLAPMQSADQVRQQLYATNPIPPALHGQAIAPDRYAPSGYVSMAEIRLRRNQEIVIWIGGYPMQVTLGADLPPFNAWGDATELAMANRMDWTRITSVSNTRPELYPPARPPGPPGPPGPPPGHPPGVTGHQPEGEADAPPTAEESVAME